MIVKLSVELVPKTAWYNNVRSSVPKDAWDKIRKKVYEKAGHVCEICGGVGSKYAVACHEIWEYDDENHIQKLDRMIALCPSCHNVKHLGRAKVIGQYQPAVSQLMKVNGWSREEVHKYEKEVFVKWSERSKHDWNLNLDALNEYL